MLRQGFSECFRVLKLGGTLIFKWSELDIPTKEVLALTPMKPLYGHISGKRSKTHWIAFIKEPEEQKVQVKTIREAAEENANEIDLKCPRCGFYFGTQESNPDDIVTGIANGQTIQCENCGEYFKVWLIPDLTPKVRFDEDWSLNTQTK
jgi:transcription elongation factor Elf1